MRTAAFLFPGKEALGARAACSVHSVLGDLLLPKEMRQKGHPQQVGRPTGGPQNRVPSAKHGRFYWPFLSITTSASRRSLNLEQLTGRSQRLLGMLPAVPLLDNWELRLWGGVGSRKISCDLNSAPLSHSISIVTWTRREPLAGWG